jgi:hypothetical protein
MTGMTLGTLVRVVVIDSGKDSCRLMDAVTIGGRGDIQVVASLVAPHDQERLDPERLLAAGTVSLRPDGSVTFVVSSGRVRII